MIAWKRAAKGYKRRHGMLAERLRRVEREMMDAPVDLTEATPNGLRLMAPLHVRVRRLLSQCEELGQTVAELEAENEQLRTLLELRRAA